MGKLLLCLILISLFSTGNSFADGDMVEKGEDMLSDYLEPLRYVETLTEPVKRQLKDNKIDLNFFLGLLQGLDNNVNLEKDKETGAFSDTSLNTEVMYNYTDDVRLKLENDTSFLMYYAHSDATFLDIYNVVGLEADVFDDMFTAGTDYAFGYIWFPDDKDGNYITNSIDVSLKYNVNPNLYHKISYEAMFKNFTHYKTINPNKVTTSDLRQDYRNTAGYETGLYLFDRLMLKVNLELYYNASNYDYFHYYDYWSFRVRPSCIFMITDKLYLSGNFAYRQRQYNDRLSSEDNEHVYDDTYTFSGSALYDLTDSFTLGASCTYQENYSNEPLQEYNAGTITAGAYYSF